MENDPLDELLDAAARTPVPLPPGDLESRVWREIRNRRSRTGEALGLRVWLLGLWHQMRLARAAVTVALIVGVFMGHRSARLSQKSFAQFSHSETGDSLGLRVFSADPPAMPSTLLAQQP